MLPTSTTTLSAVSCSALLALLPGGGKARPRYEEDKLYWFNRDDNASLTKGSERRTSWDCINELEAEIRAGSEANSGTERA